MRISIKIKFSVFLAVLLLLTVIVLSLLVLRGIRTNQTDRYEEYLTRQSETANVYFLQTILTESNKVPQIFLSTKGAWFAKQLELLTGQAVVLYDMDGEAVSKKLTPKEAERISRTLTYALENKTAYMVEGKELYYLTPLKIENEQVGVMQLYYSLSEEVRFYRTIRNTFLTVGAGIFLLSFLLAFVYFDFFANGIMKLEQMVDRVRQGQYEVKPLKRRDEIGRLSEGIRSMSDQIRMTMRGMEEEQEKLTRAVHKLSLLDQQQKQFIGNVTHEFKTPLTSIKAYLDLLEMYPDDERLPETAISNIKSETNRLQDMVDKVLQLSVLEKYDFEYHPERIELSRLLKSVLQSLKGKLDKFGLRLETDLTEAYVYADKDSMTIILINLLDNAIKYNKAKGKVAVRNFRQDQQVIIEISDSGIGIPKEAADRIFEPFYTVDKNRSRASGGAGLGLSIVRKNTELLGGRIALADTGEEGSTFRLSFPEAADDEMFTK